MSNTGPTFFGKAFIPVGLLLVAVSTVVVVLEFDGFVDKLSPTLMVVGAFGVVIASMLLFRPSLLMWISTLITLVVVGVVSSFFGAEKLSWISYGIAGLLYVPAFASLLSGGTPLNGEHGGGILLFFLGIFVFIGIAGWGQDPPKFQTIAAVAKSWVMFGGVWAFLALYPLSQRWVRNWLYGILIIAFLQWVPILYQAVFLRIQRASQGRYYSPDVVVGTFGGSPDGGGLTGVLALFLVACSFVILALFRSRVLSRTSTFLGLAVILTPLVLVEVKAIFFYLPVGIFILYRDQLLAKPVTFLMGSALFAGFIFAGIFLYNAIHWKGEEGIAAHKFGYSFSIDPGYRAPDGRLTRLGAVVYWWESNQNASAMRLAFGYGFGSARTVGLATGHVADKHVPMELDKTGFSLLLWEVGIIGTLVWYAFLGAGFAMAVRLTKTLEPGAWPSGLAYGLQAIIPVFGLSILYRNDIPYAGPSMFLFMASLGLLFWLHRSTIRQKYH